jgi:hypothetical protein
MTRIDLHRQLTSSEQGRSSLPQQMNTFLAYSGQYDARRGYVYITTIKNHARSHDKKRRRGSTSDRRSDSTHVRVHAFDASEIRDRWPRRARSWAS